MHVQLSRLLTVPWAKANHKTGAYHPLICHLIDVAMVARLLWKEALAPAARLRLTSALGMSGTAATTWVAFLAGLHDLGKLAPDFQLDRYPGDHRKIAVQLATAGLSGTATGSLARPHGLLTAAHVPTLLERELGVPRPAALRLGEILGGHHGCFQSHNEILRACRTSSYSRTWDEARRQHLIALSDAVGLDRAALPGRPDDGSAMVLAGLVSVADWIASMVQYFPWLCTDGTAPDGFDLIAYCERAERQARETLAALHWTGWMPKPEPVSFTELFPFQPRGVQETVNELAATLAQPGLIVIEAPTGDGKTEAALQLAECAQAAAGTRGMYLAMPTMATSDQMLTRVHQFLASRYPGGGALLELLHGHAALSEELNLLRALGCPGGIDGPEESGVDASVLAGEWFARRKRGLLATFGVGTIDQALLAALRVRHVFVRLFGLAHKTVIVDEVHAYDVYMTSLLERLLEWLGACGSLVILLSATLPASRREHLMAAYARGAQWPAVVTLPACPYPRLSWVTAASADAVPVPCSSVSRRRLRLDWAVGEDASPERLALRAVQEIRDGGCAAIVCNTVGMAQRVYEVARGLLPEDADDGEPPVGLLHAQFLFKDRLERQNRCLRRFGKQGQSVRRPRKALLVATQVIEQSLDLDFDVMISQIAPADLLLQRAGRLHRHDRSDRWGPATPLLIVACPEDTDGPQPDAGTLAIYDEHVLLRTWLVLRLRHQIRVPEEVEEVIEAVYGVDDPPATVSGAVRERWQSTGARLRQEREYDEIEAEKRWIQPPDTDHSLYDLVHGDLAEDAPELHEAHQALTRLGPPSVEVVCLEARGGRLVLSDGTEVDPDAEPPMELVKGLLQHSVSIRQRGLTQALLKKEVPPGWRRSPLLCRHRLIELEQGEASIDDGRKRWTVRLDPDLGLVTEWRGPRHPPRLGCPHTRGGEPYRSVRRGDDVQPG
jgi:CRISPR-associated endonuclease/helicase Cas3